MTEIKKRKVDSPRVALRIGYIRAGAGEDPLEQRRQLLASGSDEIFEDIDVAASAVFKPSLIAALKRAQRGDEIIVSRLDRLGSTLGTLMMDLQLIESIGLRFKSVHEGISSDPGGEFYRHVRMLAGFQRDVAATRRQAEAAEREAIAAGERHGGQPALIAADVWEEYRALMKIDKSWTAARVAKVLGVSRQAIHKRMKAAA